MLIRQFIVMTFANYVPVLFAVLFFRGGGRSCGR